MTTITVHTPRSVVAPRGAAWAAWLFRQASMGIDWLVHSRTVRAERRTMAGRIADANLVRNHARNVAVTDPGFAADLYAAADRHELAD
jgi:hypothetical protein